MNGFSNTLLGGFIAIVAGSIPVIINNYFKNKEKVLNEKRSLYFQALKQIPILTINLNDNHKNKGNNYENTEKILAIHAELVIYGTKEIAASFLEIVSRPLHDDNFDTKILANDKDVFLKLIEDDLKKFE